MAFLTGLLRHLVIRGLVGAHLFRHERRLHPLLEEPQLRHRFGAEYIEYCKHVPRLLPRLRPWQPIPLKPLQ